MASREKDQMATAVIQNFTEKNGPSIQTTQHPWEKASVQALTSPTLVYTASEIHTIPKAHTPYVLCRDQSNKINFLGIPDFSMTSSHQLQQVHPVQHHHYKH